MPNKQSKNLILVYSIQKLLLCSVTVTNIVAYLACYTISKWDNDAISNGKNYKKFLWAIRIFDISNICSKTKWIFFYFKTKLHYFFATISSLIFVYSKTLIKQSLFNLKYDFSMAFLKMYVYLIISIILAEIY